MLSPRLVSKLDTLPDSPGVYLFKDSEGAIIYIGKALSLRNRVRQYFQTHRAGEKVSFLVQEIADFELVVVDSEKEAWLLEQSLIRRNRPKYNTDLKDDKQYPFLRLTTEPFPRLSIVRRVEKDAARYFGPYIPASGARTSLTLAQKLFQIRWCTEKMGGRKRPCLDYYIRRCLGPCANLVTADLYGDATRSCVLFLEGRHDELVDSMREKMQRAADEERFEDAARLRDIVADLERIRERQKIIVPHLVDQDVFGMHRSGSSVLVLVFNRRRGIVVDKREFLASAPAEATDDEIVADVLFEFYEQAPIPQNVLVPYAQSGVVDEILSEKAGRRVYVQSPARGEGRRLLDLLARNARQRFEARSSADPERRRALADLQSALDLPAAPVRIEGFDISHLGGTDTVASLVVFIDGLPAKREYRRFHVRSVKGADDFQSMREVVFRRYKRVLEEDSPRPDLVLIDGGRGQLSAALEALADASASTLPVASLAKREEEIYTPRSVEPIRLSADSPARLLLQRVRDEAHRFAVTFQRRTRERALKVRNARGRKRRNA